MHMADALVAPAVAGTMNRVHPLVKFILTIGYIVVAVSFPKYDLIGLLGMAVYLIAGFLLAELSFGKCLRRLHVVLPLVCMVGLANPFFDRIAVWIGGFCIRTGVISMFTLMLKGIFAVRASYLLIATTTLEQICYALQLLHVPQIMVPQVMLTGRYLTLLLAEVNRTTQAYALRAPNQKGVHTRMRRQDLVYLFIWCMLFAVLRKVPVILWVRRMITGV